MTKIKNTKKGMTKKTLSMSLVVAMLATSNVPVWAADFSDGTDTAVTSEAEAPAVVETPAETETTEEFSDNAAETAEAPVVEENEEEVSAQAIEEASEKYSFNKVTVKKDAVNPTWKGGLTAADLFEEDSDIVNSTSGGTDYDDDLYYVFAIDGSWDENGVWGNRIINGDLSSSNIEISGDELKKNVGKSLQLLIVEETNNSSDRINIVKRFSLGTIQNADLQSELTVTAPTNVTYDGTDKRDEIKPIINGNVEVTSLTADSFDWTFHYTNGNYVDAGSVITATGKLINPIPGYTDTVTTTCTIGKRELAIDDIVVKVTTPGKNFEYQNNDALEIDKSEVSVSLKDFSKEDGKTYASSVSLNDFVKTVTVNTTSVGDQELNVELDIDAINKSKNFKTKDGTTYLGVGSEANAETDAKPETKTVKVVALDLSKCDITLSNPIGVNNDIAKIKNDVLASIVIKKDGKILDLKNDIDVEIAAGNYETVKTYNDAITVKSNGSNKVTNYKKLNLTTVAKAFASDAGFSGKAFEEGLLAAKVTEVKKSMDYNDGKAVEFTKAQLGDFCPDGVGNNAGDQGYFKITYEDSVNATKDGEYAKLTVTAVGGSYKGCSKDFYFKIAPSVVKADADETVNTVTTAVDKSIGGVALNPAYTTAEQYANAIGLTVKGTNEKNDKEKIVSTATTNDYDVKYFFATEKEKDGAEEYTGVNKAGNYVIAQVTLKKDGNFKINRGAIVEAANGVKTVTSAVNDKNNGQIRFAVNIKDKSIDTLDISLKQDTFTFTGKQINPEFVVKENGKELKNTVTVVGMTDGVNAGTATITVSVSGYSGTKELKATIKPAKLSDVVFEIKKDDVDAKTFTYTGEQQKPSIAQEDDPATAKNEKFEEDDATADVKLGDEILSKMFDITYGENINAGEKAGTVTLTPKAIYAKNFDGTSLTANFDIFRRGLSVNTKIADALNIQDATGKKLTIHGNDEEGYIYDSMDWTGDIVKFASAKVNKYGLKSDNGNFEFTDENYEVVYVNATDATGDENPAYVAIIGKGNFKGNYVLWGRKDTEGNIISTRLTDEAEFTEEQKDSPATVVLLQSDVVGVAEYNILGSTFTAKNITYSNGVYAGGLNVKPVVTVKDAKTGEVLKEGTDYIVYVYSLYDTVNAGTEKIPFVIVGLGKYKNSGYIEKINGEDLTYSIDKKDLKDCDVTVTKKDDKFDVTVVNGTVTEVKENFNVKDNGDGTATVSVVNGGKNYTGSATVAINDPDAEAAVATPVISTATVSGNKVNVALASESKNATAYDYVISADNDLSDEEYVAELDGQVATDVTFTQLEKGSYYAFCRAWTRDENGKKVYSDWSEGKEFEVTAVTPETPKITEVSSYEKNGSYYVTVTYTASANAEKYGIILGTKQGKDSDGQIRPLNYGTMKKNNVNAYKTTVTFKVPKKGTYYAGLRAYNKSGENGKKVYSNWSNVEPVSVPEKPEEE